MAEWRREEAEQWLADKPMGVFVIRRSETVAHSFVLSAKVPRYVTASQLSHYLIEARPATGVYVVKGFPHKEFADLESLVAHCSVMRDIFPVMLNAKYFEVDATTTPYTHHSEQHQHHHQFYYSSASSSASSSTSSLVSLISSSRESLLAVNDASDDILGQQIHRFVSFC